MKAFSNIALASLYLFSPEEMVEGKIRPQLLENEVTGFVETPLTHSKKVRAPIVGGAEPSGGTAADPKCLFKDD